MHDLREQLDRIEYRITQGMTAAQCFAQMKQLLAAGAGATPRAAWDDLATLEREAIDREMQQPMSAPRGA